MRALDVRFKTECQLKTENGKVDASESDRCRLSRQRVEIIDSRQASLRRRFSTKTSHFDT